MAGLYSTLKAFLTPSAPTADPALGVLQQRLDSAHRRLQESYSHADSFIDPLERFYDGDTFYAPAIAGTPNARKNGGDWILLRTPLDLRELRADSRLLLGTNGLASGACDRLVDFVVGDGHQVDFALKGIDRGAVANEVGVTDPAVELAQIIWDEFNALNEWCDGVEPREPEAYLRMERDGEAFLRFFKGAPATNGIPRVRWIEPEQIEPAPGAEPNESWGIETDPDDVETRIAYYVRPINGETLEGKYLPADQVVTAKLNTDRTIKRGVPSFSIVAEAFRSVEKVNRNMTEVAAIQAAIAYVRQHPPGTLNSQMTDLVKGGADYTTSPGRNRSREGSAADRSVGVQFTDPGTMLDMKAGTTFNAGPSSTSAPAFIAALQSRLRGICARFGMPEFFSGDASNNNYASILVSGGPFEKAIKRKQKKFSGFVRAVAIKTLEYAVASGRMSQSDLDRVEVKVTPPSVSIANRKEESDIRSAEIRDGMLSVQTAQQQVGLDSRQEAANTKAWKEANPDATGGGGMDFGGLFNQEPSPDAPVPESFIDEEFYDLLSEAVRSGLVQKSITDKNGNKRIVWVRQADTTSGDKSRQRGFDSRTVVAKGIADPNRLNPEEFAALGEHLMTVNRDELRNLAKQLGEKVGGTKSALADRLAERVKAGRDVPAEPAANKATAVDTPATVDPVEREHADRVSAAKQLLETAGTSDDPQAHEKEWKTLTKSGYDGITELQHDKLTKALGIKPSGMFGDSNNMQAMDKAYAAAIRPAKDRKQLAAVMADPKKYGFGLRDAKAPGVTAHVQKELRSRSGSTPDAVHENGTVIDHNGVPHTILAAAKPSFTRGHVDGGEQVGPNAHRQHLLLRPSTTAEIREHRIKHLERSHGTMGGNEVRIDHSAELNRLRGERDADKKGGSQ